MKRALVAFFLKSDLDFATRVLEECGFDVIQCADGRAAFEQLNSNEVFDLFLAQLMLPFHDAIEAGEHFEKMQPGRTIVATAQWKPGFVIHPLEWVHFIGLPLDRQHLLLTILNLHIK